ncbi:MAG TPA: BrnT family toxin [Tepidisphaeraceae bacterium]|nr:BrnT family toxin [Tepidisphaeraceae bacterium]
MQFEWDGRKARANKAKHGVSFEEASTAFLDPRHLLLFDWEHSAAEDRMILIGMSRKLRLLTVVYVEKEADVYRIISARKATERERQRYEEAT